MKPDKARLSSFFLCLGQLLGLLVLILAALWGLHTLLNRWVSPLATPPVTTAAEEEAVETDSETETEAVSELPTTAAGEEDSADA